MSVRLGGSTLDCIKAAGTILPPPPYVNLSSSSGMLKRAIPFNTTVSLTDFDISESLMFSISDEALMAMISMPFPIAIVIWTVSMLSYLGSSTRRTEALSTLGIVASSVGVLYFHGMWRDQTGA